MITIKYLGRGFQVTNGFGIGAKSGTVYAADTFEMTLAVLHYTEAHHAAHRCPVCRETAARCAARPPLVGRATPQA